MAATLVTPPTAQGWANVPVEIQNLQVGVGIPNGRAGLEFLQKNLIVRGNVTGQVLGTLIVVAGMKRGDPILFVQPGNGGDTAGEVFVAVDGGMFATRGLDLSGLKLNVAFLSRSEFSAQSASSAQDLRPVFGALDAMLFALGCNVGAGGNAGVAITITGIDLTDVILAAFVTDATIDISASGFVPDVDKITNTAADTGDLTGKSVVCLYLATPFAGQEPTTHRAVIQPNPTGNEFTRLLKGLVFSEGDGPNGATGTESTDNSFAQMPDQDVTPCNILAVWAQDGTSLIGGNWTPHTGGPGIFTDEAADFSAKKIACLWWNQVQAETGEVLVTPPTGAPVP